MNNRVTQHGNTVVDELERLTLHMRLASSL